jgi:hypothetical protein
LDPHFNQGKLTLIETILSQAILLQANILAKCKAPLGQGTMNLTLFLHKPIPILYITSFYLFSQQVAFIVNFGQSKEVY